MSTPKAPGPLLVPLGGTGCILCGRSDGFLEIAKTPRRVIHIDTALRRTTACALRGDQ